MGAGDPACLILDRSTTALGARERLQGGSLLAVRIAIVGPDGGGKSAVADALEHSLTASGLRVRRSHFDPRTSNRQGPVTEPHARSVHPPLKSAAALLVRFIRYRQALQPGHLLSSDGVDVTLQERGWLDQMVDPRRYRLHPRTAGLARLLARYAPRYDGLVVCAGDAHAVHARKPELPLAEIQRQNRAWDELAVSHPQSLRVSTTEQTLNQSAAEAHDFVLRVRTTAALQRLRPVLFQPARLGMLATGKARAGVDALYKPASRLGRLRRRFAMRSPRSPKTPPVPFNVVADVLESLTLPADDLVVIRSAGRSRMVLALVVSQAVASFVKAAWDKESLSREAAMLTLMARETAVTVPRVLGEYTTAMSSGIALSPVNSEGASVRLDEVVDLACRLADCGETGVTHHDLAPWNLVPADPVGLVDWEHAEPALRPGHDLAYYLVTAKVDEATAREALSRYLAHVRPILSDDAPDPDDLLAFARTEAP
jgi:hypothetical protein